MSRYDGLSVAMQAVRKSDNKVVTWFSHPEHGLLPAVMNETGYEPLDKSVQWNSHQFYAPAHGHAEKAAQMATPIIIRKRKGIVTGIVLTKSGMHGTDTSQRIDDSGKITPLSGNERLFMQYTEEATPSEKQAFLEFVHANNEGVFEMVDKLPTELKRYTLDLEGYRGWHEKHRSGNIGFDGSPVYIKHDAYFDDELGELVAHTEEVSGFVSGLVPLRFLTEITE